jgi:ribonucleoside-diphosphate reductase alpha chain
MNESNKLLSDVVAFRTYAKYIPHLQRRETLQETTNRTMNQHLERFPKLSNEITKAFSLVHELKIMPSMRSMQFSGEAVNSNNARSYNCSFINMTYERAFSEILFLLLSGTGVGYSVQKRHINQLPSVRKPKEEGYFRVHDSIEGWAQSLSILLDAYFNGAIRPDFDFSGIRPKGSYLVTTGAKAPGPEPLRHMLIQVEKILIGAIGRKLRPLEVHDVNCIIADCVLSGGIRRAALISLFDKNDEEMLKCKSGTWWEKAPFRARSNNSVVLHRQETTREEFDYILKMCEESKAGEPGIFWTNDYDWGTNPCAEIALNSNQFCNLTSINQTGVTTEKEFFKRIRAATIIGTIQASYTSFPYLSEKWTHITEQEALLGVSFTGVADSTGFITPELLKEGAKLALQTNEEIAKKIGINLAARVCAVKPEGTVSTIVGSSSGVHDRHAKHYIRRIRMNESDPLAKYLKYAIPELVEQDIFSESGVVVSIPQESPKGSITREQSSALDMLERANVYNLNWIKEGHRNGMNRHNCSVTISVRDDEWNDLRNAMWTTREIYTGIALLPYDGGSYQQAPFEDIDESKYKEMEKLVKVIDLTKVKEIEDFTNRGETLACAGGVCEINL